MAENDLSPLDALQTGFLDPANPVLPHPRLRSPDGMRLVAWLREEEVGPDTVLLAEEAFRRLGERYHPQTELPVLRDRLMTQVAAGGFMNWPRFSLLLEEAILRVDSPEQWQGLLAYLRWLAQVMQIART